MVGWFNLFARLLENMIIKQRGSHIRAILTSLLTRVEQEEGIFRVKWIASSELERMEADDDDCLETVPNGYPNPTRYPVFLSIPDPTRFSFRNYRVAGNPKHRVLPNILGKPEVSGTTRYFMYHP